MLLLSIKYAFEILKVEKITLGVFENNKSGAYYFYKSCGFTEVLVKNPEYYTINSETWK
ncbi:hypothetical protein [Treponema berlinense]|uniref:hypothetical protein n=1 Tax=Treponema berlinense TaxID=225004 RepID=UPI003FD7A9DA